MSSEPGEQEGNSSHPEKEKEPEPIATLAKSLPDVPVPAASFLVGKEKLIQFPPLRLLGPKIEHLRDNEFVHRKIYLASFIIALTPNYIFSNPTKQRELAEKEAEIFEENAAIFCNSKNHEGFIFFLLFFFF